MSTRRLGFPLSLSIVHRMSWTVPPVHTSPPAGAMTDTVTFAADACVGSAARRETAIAIARAASWMLRVLARLRLVDTPPSPQTGKLR